MRTWQSPEKADIIVSELLGSFGDNELSPECLDGADRFLKGNAFYIRHFFWVYSISFYVSLSVSQFHIGFHAQYQLPVPGGLLGTTVVREYNLTSMVSTGKWTMVLVLRLRL